jgi:hypothetical protein
VLAPLRIRDAQDALRARQCAREIARVAGLDHHDQTHLIVAVSQVSRELITSRLLASMTFWVSEHPSRVLVVTVEWARPTRETYERAEQEIIGRLSRFFAAGGTITTTSLTLTTDLPVTPTELSAVTLCERVRTRLRSAPPAGALDELHHQDLAVLSILEASQARQDQLHRVRHELDAVNRELEETNRAGGRTC